MIMRYTMIQDTSGTDPDTTAERCKIFDDGSGGLTAVIYQRGGGAYAVLLRDFRGDILAAMVDEFPGCQRAEGPDLAALEHTGLCVADLEYNAAGEGPRAALYPDAMSSGTRQLFRLNR